MDIQEGDLWEFATNDGVIPRLVLTVGNKLVSYKNASGNERVCTITAFKRWAKGAELEYRKPNNDS